MRNFYYYYICDCGTNHRCRGRFDIKHLDYNQEELVIYGCRKSFYIVIGHSLNGCYLCMPSLNVACPFDITDIGSIYKYLVSRLNMKESYLIVYGLKKYYGDKITKTVILTNK